MSFESTVKFYLANAIDGTQLSIRNQAGDDLHNEYINRKGLASIACQAVVDADGIFHSVSV